MTAMLLARDRCLPKYKVILSNTDSHFAIRFHLLDEMLRLHTLISRRRKIQPCARPCVYSARRLPVSDKGG